MSVSVIESRHKDFARAVIYLAVYRMHLACSIGPAAACACLSCTSRISADSVVKHLIRIDVMGLTFADELGQEIRLLPPCFSIT